MCCEELSESPSVQYFSVQRMAEISQLDLGLWWVSMIWTGSAGHQGGRVCALVSCHAPTNLTNQVRLSI